MVYNSSVIVCALLQSEGKSTFTSVYNHEVYYSFCLIDCMFWAMCYSLHVDPFSQHAHPQCEKCYWSQGTVHHHGYSPPPSTHLCSHFLLLLATPTSAKIKLLCFISIETLPAVVHQLQ